MTLQDKIYKNLVDQMSEGLRAQALREQLTKSDSNAQVLQGRISMLSEMWQEETGTDLQKCVNTEPSWKRLVDEAQAEAKRIVAGEGITAPQVAAATAPPVGSPSGKRQTTNRQVAPVLKPAKLVEKDNSVVVEDKGAAEAMPTLNRTTTTDRKEPIKITIDDAPQGPPPEGTKDNDDD